MEFGYAARAILRWHLSSMLSQGLPVRMRSRELGRAAGLASIARDANLGLKRTRDPSVTRFAPCNVRRDYADGSTQTLSTPRCYLPRLRRISLSRLFSSTRKLCGLNYCYSLTYIFARPRASFRLCLNCSCLHIVIELSFPV